MITHVTRVTKSCNYFDCCASADSESDFADSAAADIDEPASGSNRIEPDLTPEGEAEDSRAPAAIAPEHAPEGEFSEDDGPDYPEYEGSEHCIYTHLAKLDGLAARGCAGKFFQTHAKRWESGMPRRGDLIHSAQADGVDVRTTRKRKAEGSIAA
jgi:hypothetical protein